ncbi:hypothetical protein DIPPA_58034 [Diplonema papillatum]|nr:hypothetical protein DIPPA_58034 [Diplonema papillatum]
MKQTVLDIHSRLGELSSTEDVEWAEQHQDLFAEKYKGRLTRSELECLLCQTPEGAVKREYRQQLQAVLPAYVKRNRRLSAMRRADIEDQYFSLASIKKRDAKIYHLYIGQYEAPTLESTESEATVSEMVVDGSLEAGTALTMQMQHLEQFVTRTSEVLKQTHSDNLQGSCPSTVLDSERPSVAYQTGLSASSQGDVDNVRLDASPAPAGLEMLQTGNFQESTAQVDELMSSEIEFKFEVQTHSTRSSREAVKASRRLQKQGTAHGGATGPTDGNRGTVAESSFFGGPSGEEEWQSSDDEEASSRLMQGKERAMHPRAKPRSPPPSCGVSETRCTSRISISRATSEPMHSPSLTDAARIPTNQVTEEEYQDNFELMVDLMKSRYLSGNDGHVDYLTVETSDRFDDLATMATDAQDAYFEESSNSENGSSESCNKRPLPAPSQPLSKQSRYLAAVTRLNGGQRHQNISCTEETNWGW